MKRRVAWANFGGAESYRFSGRSRMTTRWSNIRLSEAKRWFRAIRSTASSNSRASSGYHVVILTMVLHLRITMSALPPRADTLSASIDVC